MLTIIRDLDCCDDGLSGSKVEICSSARTATKPPQDRVTANLIMKSFKPD
jgi:hypothetical protein